MNKNLLLSFSLLIFIISAPDVVSACSCVGGANPCGAFGSKTGAIFTGTVTEVTSSTEKYGKPVNGKVRKIAVRVDEIFKGELPVEIVTYDDGFSCDNYPFVIGKSYLIYSNGILENSENIVRVGLCSGTVPIEKADGHLRFLRPLKAGKTFSLIFGQVQRFTHGDQQPNEPLNGVKVVLEKKFAIENGQYRKPKGKDRERLAVTDGFGNYDFKDIPLGRYKMRVELPSGL